MVRWKHLHLSVGLLSVWCECTQRHTHPVSVSACLILTCSQTWLVRSRSMQFSDLLCVKLAESRFGEIPIFATGLYRFNPNS